MGGSTAVASRHSTGLHLSERCTASVLHNVANVINVMEIRGGVAGGREGDGGTAFVCTRGLVSVALLGSGASKRGLK